MHSAVSKLSDDVGHLRLKVSEIEQARLETAPASGSSPSGPNPHDPALRQVAFLGFPQASSPEQRIEAMQTFMRRNFPKIQLKHVDLSLNKDGDVTTNGFVELGSKQHARHVTSTSKSRGIKVPGFESVIVKPENTDIDRNRNWAIKMAEKLIKDDPKAAGTNIEKNNAKDRGIKVNGRPAFVQHGRYSKGGEFVGEFAHLRLP